MCPLYCTTTNTDKQVLAGRGYGLAVDWWQLGMLLLEVQLRYTNTFDQYTLLLTRHNANVD
jgi:hypothetical protein